MTGRGWIWGVMKDLIGFHGHSLHPPHIHSYSNLLYFDMKRLHGFGQRGFISFPLLLSTTTLTASPRGNHSGIIMGIQFGFVNVDRALLHPDTRVRWKWSSAFSRSVASLSPKLLSSAAADRRPSHSSLKGLFFLPVSCQRRSPRRSVPGPTFWLPLWVWAEESAAYIPRSMHLGPCDSRSTSEIVQTHLKQPTGPPAIWNRLKSVGIQPGAPCFYCWAQLALCFWNCDVDTQRTPMCTSPLCTANIDTDVAEYCSYYRKCHEYFLSLPPCNSNCGTFTARHIFLNSS